jgi:hypothetical protein
MEKGRAGLLSEKEGGSTRRTVELDARRLEMAWTRLFLGDPRLQLMGVDLAVLGEETVLRTEEREDAGEAVMDLAGVVVSEYLAGLVKASAAERDGLVKTSLTERDGLVKTSLAVRDFLGGELKAPGSTFSASSSSKMSGSASRWRLPVEGAAVGLMGDA